MNIGATEWIPPPIAHPPRREKPFRHGTPFTALPLLQLPASFRRTPESPKWWQSRNWETPEITPKEAILRASGLA